MTLMQQYQAWRTERQGAGKTYAIDEFFKDKDICPACWGKGVTPNKFSQPVTCTRCKGDGKFHECA